MLRQAGQEAGILGKGILMRIELPSDVEYIISELQKRGHEAYAVGGCPIEK